MGFARGVRVCVLEHDNRGRERDADERPVLVFLHAAVPFLALRAAHLGEEFPPVPLPGRRRVQVVPGDRAPVAPAPARPRNSSVRVRLARAAAAYDREYVRVDVDWQSVRVVVRSPATHRHALEMEGKRQRDR